MVLAVFGLLILLFVILPLAGVALWFVITTAIVGVIFGGLGRLIVPGHQPIGLLATICCGWIGSLIGGGVGRGVGFGHIATLLVEIGVSAAAVAVWSGVQRKSVSGANRDAITR